MQGFNYPLENDQENYGSQTSLNTKNALSSITRQSPLSTKTTNINQVFNINSQNQNLEQENQQLKSKVELLQSILLGICKDQHIEHPLLQQLTKSQKFQLDLAQLQPLPSQSPKEIQFNKSNKKKENLQQKLFKSTEKEKLITSTRETNFSCSPLKSTQRRKRSQREKNSQNQNKTLNEISQTKIEVTEQLPLQIQDRQKCVMETSETNRTEMNQTSEFQFDANQEALDSTLFNYPHVQQQNPAQIQLKYVKMLEDLEQQSQIEKQSSKEINDFNKTATLLLHELQNDLISSTRSFHQKNKNSSHIEHKQFYENELYSLKNELENFEKEEEKLMKIIEKKTNRNSQGHTQILDSAKTPIKVQEYKNVVIIDSNTKEEIKEEDVSSCRYEDDSQSQIEEQTQRNPHHEQLMRNLVEEHKFIKNQSDSSFELIKPVKISSPLNKFNLCEADFEHYEEPTQIRVTPRELINVASLEEIVTPVRNCLEPKIKEEAKSKPQPKKTTKVTTYNIPSQTPTKMTFMNTIKHSSVPQSSLKKTSDKKNNIIKLRQQIQEKNTQKFQISSILNKMEQTSSHSPFRFMMGRAKSSMDKQEEIKEVNTKVDQMSRGGALAKGLTQQEVPYEDEPVLEELVTSIRHSRKEIAEMKRMTDEEYFGIYSREKGEEIKSQRSRSIKKCEELLKDLVQYEQNFKRPDFLNIYAPIKLQKYQTAKCSTPYDDCENLDKGEAYHSQDQTERRNSEQELLQQLELASANIAHQISKAGSEDKEDQAEELDDQRTVDQSEIHSQCHIEGENQEQDDEVAQINSSVHCHSKQSSNQGLINIQVPHSNMFLLQQQSCQEAPNPEELPFTSFQNEPEKPEASQLQTLNTAELNESTTETPLINAQKYSEDKVNQFLMKKNSIETGCLQPRIMAKTTPINKDKGTQKPSPFSQTPINNFEDKSSISPFNYEKTLRMGDSTRLSICKNNKDIYIYNPNNIDLEMLYERKSKSVMKKREELLKQKEQKTRQKLEEKYQRMENFRKSKREAHSQKKQLSKSKSATKIMEQSHERTSISTNDGKEIKTNLDQITVNDVPRKFSCTSHLGKPKSSFQSYTKSSNTASFNNTHKNSNISSECGSYRIQNDGFQKGLKREQIYPYFRKDPSILTQVIAHRQQRISMKQSISDNDNQFLQKIQTTSKVSVPSQFEKTSHLSNMLNSSRVKQELDKKKNKHNFVPSQMVIPEKKERKSLSKSKSVVKKKLNSSKSANKVEGSQFSSKQSQVIVSAEEECDNCVRLMKKGISTEFCLKHL